MRSSSGISREVITFLHGREAYDEAVNISSKMLIIMFNPLTLDHRVKVV